MNLTSTPELLTEKAIAGETNALIEKMSGKFKDPRHMEAGRQLAQAEVQKERNVLGVKMAMPQEEWLEAEKIVKLCERLDLKLSAKDGTLSISDIDGKRIAFIHYTTDTKISALVGLLQVGAESHYEKKSPTKQAFVSKSGEVLSGLSAESTQRLRDLEKSYGITFENLGYALRDGQAHTIVSSKNGKIQIDTDRFEVSQHARKALIAAEKLKVTNPR